MKFPVNVEAVTIWEKTIVDRAPAYIRHEIGPAYWQGQSGQTIDGKSRNQEDSIFCAIPVDSLSNYLPKRDDLLVSGLCGENFPSGKKFTIVNVKNFLYGSEEMQHIEVTAV